MTTTFVSALIDLNENRPIGKGLSNYLEHFKYLANTGLPFHVFVSSSFHDKFKEVYQSYKNIYSEVVNLEDLETYIDIKEVKYSRPSVIVEHEKQTTNYNIMNNSKIEFIKKAIDKDIYSTTQFAWIDFGINHVIKNKETYKKLQYTRLSISNVVIPTIWQRSSDRANDFNHINWRFAGGFFIGKKDCLVSFYNLYRQEFRKAVEAYGILPWEVNMMAYFEENFNFLPDTYSADHNDSILNIPTQYLMPNSTIVTMFFDLKSLPDASSQLRPIEFYLEKAKDVLSLDYPMVLFCDSTTKPKLEVLRGSKSTHYVERNITDYDYFKFLHPIVTDNRKKIPSPDARNTPSYFLLMIFKFYALFMSKQYNYFPNTSHYFWIDIGASHVVRCVPKNIPIMLDNPREKIACCYIHYRSKDELYPIKRYLSNGGKTGIAGGVISVEHNFIDKFYLKILSIFYQQISEGVGHSDEQILTYCYDQNPEMFTLYFGDYYSLVNNYHKSIEDHYSIHTYFIRNAKIAGREDLVNKALQTL